MLGKHSGRAALADRARQLGYHLTGEQLQTVFEQFKDLADKKKDIYDGDIVALVRQQIGDVEKEAWSFVDFQVTSGTHHQPTVRLTLRRGDEQFTEELSDGDGPIDAAFLATEKITGMKLNCREFQVKSSTIGHDAQGEATLEVEYEGELYRGRGVSTDTVEATVLALLNAVNRIASQESPAADQGASQPAGKNGNGRSPSSESGQESEVTG